MSCEEGASKGVETPLNSPVKAGMPEVLEWNPSAQEILVMVAASVLSLMVALDACVIVTSLNVGLP
jgi:hypothetical protein